MISPDTPEDTPVLYLATQFITPAKILIMWTDGTCDIRTDDGETLVDVPLDCLSLREPCAKHPVPYVGCCA